MRLRSGICMKSMIFALLTHNLNLFPPLLAQGAGTMSLLNRIKISTKLAIVFFTNFILIVAMGITAYFGSSNIQAQLSSVLDKDFKGAMFLLEADRDLHQMLIALRAMCTLEKGGEQYTEQMKDYTDNRGQADTRVNKFFADINTPETKALVDGYFADRKDWDMVADRIFAEIDAGNEEAALKISHGEGKQQFDKMRDNLDKLTGIVQSMAAEKETSSQRSFHNSMIILTALTVGSILLGSLVTFLISRNITVPLRRMMAFARKVGARDYDSRLDVHQKDEVGVLADAFREMVSQLKVNMEEVGRQTELAEDKANQAAEALAVAEEAQHKAESARKEGVLAAADRLQGIVDVVLSASREIQVQIDESSRGSEEQARRVSETATAMEEMNATVLEVARNATRTAETSEEAKQNAEEGSRIVNKVVDGIAMVQSQSQELKEDMSTLGKQAEDIGQILSVITDIADQTNLLALNAAIEAARAGEAGRGFAVVAGEVRKLAEKTMRATSEVGQAINGIQHGARKNITNVDRSSETISEATTLAGQSGDSLRSIVQLVDMAADQVRSIATASEQQSAASDEINRSIEEIDRISSETSQALQLSVNAVNDLTDQTRSLQELIAQLRKDAGQ
ncbi:methyl-accepting chemotaxis protein [Oceanidesulfovibrio marinus]|uniref:Methyl-accepting chemotaxis protein n=2 Tax=Oceanidesulfovibrio marinus TaxID=370038 RepID=A0A6P1ZHH2_9BACT|nr:methyl-accepting chemotaxis protein [Oceanidesulfovibrio marinus]